MLDLALGHYKNLKILDARLPKNGHTENFIYTRTQQMIQNVYYTQCQRLQCHLQNRILPIE